MSGTGRVKEPIIPVRAFGLYSITPLAAHCHRLQFAISSTPPDMYDKINHTT